MKRRKGVVGPGALAGVLAGSALILWFLVIDLLHGQPLQTPTFLASAVFGADPAAIGAVRILLYTLLHYIAFVALGIAIALLAARLAIAGGFLLGIVIGFLLFDVMFYASVAVVGVNVVENLGWPAVLGANILAGIVLMMTLRLTGVTRPVSLRELMAGHPILRDGVIGGLFGAIVVAVWFLVSDTLVRRPFYTPAALGSALLFGASSPAEVQFTLGAILGYTLVHIAAFIIIGTVAAAFFVGAERQPALILAFILVFVTFEAVLLGYFALLGIWIPEVLGWWSIVIANALAAAAIIAYLWWRHPSVIDRLREEETLEGPSLQ